MGYITSISKTDPNRRGRENEYSGSQGPPTGTRRENKERSLYNEYR